MESSYGVCLKAPKFYTFNARLYYSRYLPRLWHRKGLYSEYIHREPINKRMTHIKTSAICIFLVFALTACGAGSSANNPPSALTSSNSQTTETTDEQFTSAYLTGIYCSCGPTTSTNSSISDDIASLDYVDGILVRISWADLQPSTNSYDWMLLDAQIALAAEYDRHIVLAIMNGPFAPTWLASEGATTFDYPFRGNTETL
ncbi:MAG: beta-galactosidase, partial [Oleibacter sp.]|nr:beta-galactosidase [Thalassolituus sp.]